MGVTMGVAFAKKAGVNIISDGGAAGTFLYYKPWIWYGAYLVGVIFGILYWEYKQGAKYEL